MACWLGDVPAGAEPFSKPDPDTPFVAPGLPRAGLDFLNWQIGKFIGSYGYTAKIDWSEGFGLPGIRLCAQGLAFRRQLRVLLRVVDDHRNTSLTCNKTLRLYHTGGGQRGLETANTVFRLSLIYFRPTEKLSTVAERIGFLR